MWHASLTGLSSLAQSSSWFSKGPHAEWWPLCCLNQLRLMWRARPRSSRPGGAQQSLPPRHANGAKMYSSPPPTLTSFSSIPSPQYQHRHTDTGAHTHTCTFTPIPPDSRPPLQQSEHSCQNSSISRVMTERARGKDRERGMEQQKAREALGGTKCHV